MKASHEKIIQQEAKAFFWGEVDWVSRNSGQYKEAGYNEGLSIVAEEIAGSWTAGDDESEEYEKLYEQVFEDLRDEVERLGGFEEIDRLQAIAVGYKRRARIGSEFGDWSAFKEWGKSNQEDIQALSMELDAQEAASLEAWTLAQSIPEPRASEDRRSPCAL